MSKSRNKRKPQEPKSNRALIIVICALVAALAALIALYYAGSGAKGGAKDGADTDWFDPSAEIGNLPGKTQEEIQAELNKKVEEGMFNISIASMVYMENGDSQALARIENIAANRYHMSVVITLDDTGETIYESKGIRPGQYIEYITLQKKLAQGKYNATALFTAHQQEDFTPMGQAAAKIQIVVEN